MHEIGNWIIDVETRAFDPSQRMKEFFGYYIDEVMSLENSLECVTEEYREKTKEAIEKAFLKGESYNIEYPVIGLHDKTFRWLRDQAKFYPAKEGKPAHYSGTVLDITERKEFEQRKDDFISIASHELKTPVSSLKAALQLMDRIKNKPAPEMMIRLIDQANKSMDKISGLIEELLNVSRMNEGELKLNKTTFTLAHMMQQCCNHIREDGIHKLIFSGNENLQVHADENRVDQVVVNLVNNAVKYAPGCSDIHLSVEKENSMALVKVRDCGPGIAKEKLQHLFDRYYRVDHGSHHQSGLGLGLYISSEIIKRHNGQIGVKSEVGEGTTFWFTLPL
ncbi:MAG: domain S-box-containing protein [Chitinophagaceae bacterium]|nr:domain S-box-containing protein [Chitinophagaceae bacterium]